LPISVQSEIARRAHRMAASAGAGFEAVVKPHKYTARAFVQTRDQVGRVRQATEAVLQRTLGLPAGYQPPTQSAPAKPRSDGKMLFSTKSGKQVWASPAQILNWTRNG